MDITKWIRFQAATRQPLNIHAVQREQPDLLEQAFAGPTPRGCNRPIVGREDIKPTAMIQESVTILQRSGSQACRRRNRTLMIPRIWLTMGCLVTLATAAEQPVAKPVAKPATELLRDASFRDGFVLLCPQPGHEVVSGTVHRPGRDAPVWQLAQWSSRFPFDETTVATPRAGGMLQISTAARSVSFGDGILTLALNAATEYGEHPRAAADPWVHLLVQQPIAALPGLGDLTALRLHVEARRVRARLLRSAGYDSQIHAAQFLIYITVQNLDKDSLGYGNFLWFGVPVFDDRSRKTQTYAAPDFGGTGKFIYTPGSANFTSDSTHDDGWVTFDADLLPLMHEGLTAARTRGFLKGSEGDVQFRVAALNMGWEVPGSFDVEMQVCRLGLTASTR